MLSSARAESAAANSLNGIFGLGAHGVRAARDWLHDDLRCGCFQCTYLHVVLLFQNTSMYAAPDAENLSSTIECSIDDQLLSHVRTLCLWYGGIGTQLDAGSLAQREPSLCVLARYLQLLSGPSYSQTLLTLT
jgi:hypothetical protein